MHRLIHTFIIFFLFQALLSNIEAKEISAETAKKAAESWFYNSLVFNKLASENRIFSIKSRGNFERGILTLQNEKNSAPLGFIIELEPTGFIVLPADDRLKPILGYSETSSFDTTKTYENIPFDFLITDLTLKRNALAAGAIAPARIKEAERQWQNLLNNYHPGLKLNQWKNSRQLRWAVEVGPLLSTEWNQGIQNGYNVFNLYTPNGWPCGCVALAMAEILKYYHWPPVGTGSHSYYEDGRYHYANFAGTTYLWDLMLNSYWGNSRFANRDAAGTLAYHCGIAVDMDYGLYGSVASTSDVANALYDYFRHSGSYASRSNSNFYSYLYSNITNYRPTQLAIKSSSGVGHSIVVDGVRHNSGGTKYYHLVMGWSGMGDGWYDITQNFVSGGATWSSLTGLVYDILPIPMVNGMDTCHTGSYVVSWQVSPQLNADYFRLQEGTGPSTNISWTTISSSISDTFYVVSGKTNDRYYYRVKAHRDGKWWLYSKWRSVHVVLDPPTLAVNSNTWNAPPDGGESLEFEITNSGSGPSFNYQLEENLDWLSLSSLFGTTPGSFRMTVSPNYSGSVRSGDVTVWAESGVGGSPQIISVTQDTSNRADYVLDFDGTDDSFYIPDTNDKLDLGSTWTIEFWLNLKGRSGTDNIFYRHDQFEIVIYNPSVPKDYRIQFNALGGGTPLRYLKTEGLEEECLYNTWYHVAACCDVDSARLFVNGKKVMSDASAFWDFTGAGFDNSLNIGAEYANGTYQQYLNGYLDEIRISDIARYTSDFSIPINHRLASDEHTRLLLHLDEGTGTVLNDASGNFSPSLNRGVPHIPSWKSKSQILSQTLSVSMNSWDISSEGGISPEITMENIGSGNPINYTVTENAEWLSVSSSGGATPGSFTITADENPVNFPRSDTITVSAIPPVNNSPQQIVVHQEENRRNDYALGFDGLNDSFYIPDRNDKLDLGDSWTIELWLNVHSRSGEEVVLYRHDQFEIQIAEPTGSKDYRLYFRALDGATSKRYLRTTGDDEELSFNTWYHIAASCYDNNARLFVNGKQVMSDISDYWSFFGDGFDNALNVGAKYAGTYQSYLNGYLDEIRISDICRYTTDFTVSFENPTFIADDYTRLLLHLDEGSGTELHDSAGNFTPSLNRGEPFDPYWVPVDSFLSVFVDAKAFLQGPYNNSSMSTILKNNGYIPLSQPYNVTPYNYNGSENVASIPSGIVDWILVALRSDPGASGLVAVRAAFIRSDGKIVDLDGISPVRFDVPAGDYYLVIYHRNHLAIMSANQHSLNDRSTLFDFTSAMSQAYGSNPMIDLGEGNYGMFAGDANADGQVTSTDFNIFNPAAQTAQSGYHSADWNLDGQVTSLDFNIFNPNAKNAAQSKVPNGLQALNIKPPMIKQQENSHEKRITR